ncbi:EAL domain-containing protein [Colwellia sp. KU-HH00111]|uniref:putative bifunctional diguanylate cyclase/phosphodiesterase n=1 Tax=Colwellia sp. KU-HH00111 TaxID=3127652 RepID=UPI0033656D8B
MAPWINISQAIGVAIIVLNLAIYYRKQNVPFAAGILLFCMFAIHMVNVTFAGGIDTVHYAWIFIFPVLAGGTMAWRGQLFFWFICMLGTIYYYIWPEQMAELPYEGDLEYTLATRLVCITIFSLVMLTYHFTLREKMDHVHKALKLATFEGDLFAGVFNSRAQSVILVDSNGTIERANATTHTTFSFNDSHLIGQHIGILCEHADRLFDTNRQHLSGQELEIKTHKGNSLWIEFTSIEVEDEIGKRHTLLTIEDISQRKRFESKLSHLAHFDHLTNIPNRLMIQDKIKEMIEEDTTASFYVIFIDLDKFKDINDMLGHEAGDKVLLEVASRLQTNIRSGDFIGRFGGDEFILLTRSATTEEETKQLIKSLQKILALPIYYEKTESVVGSTAGISSYPTDGQAGNDLIRKADAAMYRTKKNHKGAFSFYNVQYDADLQRKLHLNSALRNAISNNELSLLFQPIFDHHQQLLGAEALVRWKHGEYGAISPDEFIPISEENGQIIEIGLWVLDQACQVLKEWQDEGRFDLTMSVNISYRQIVGTTLVTSIENALKKHALKGDKLILELTERVIAEDLDLVNQNLTLLTAMGVRCAVDDFGIAYSSLNYLQKVDFDILKIDRSFVDGIVDDEDSLNLCKGILSMAHSLGLLVTAEGIETEAQFNLLCSLGIDKYQGFHLARPIERRKFSELFT